MGYMMPGFFSPLPVEFGLRFAANVSSEHTHSTEFYAICCALCGNVSKIMRF